MARNYLKASLLLLLALLLIGTGSETSESEAYKKTAAVAGEVLSPFCPGRTLQDCPSGPARDLKKSIREKFMSGSTEEEVFDYLYATYGEELRAAPQFEHFGIIAWVIPALFLLIGMGLIVWWLQKQKSQKLSSDELEEYF